MTEVTAEDLQVLAQADEDDAVLALVDGDVVVVSEAELGGDARVIMTKETLYEQLGEEVSDFEAVILAGRLTADMSVAEPGPGDPTEPGPLEAEPFEAESFGSETSGSAPLGSETSEPEPFESEPGRLPPA